MVNEAKTVEDSRAQINPETPSRYEQRSTFLGCQHIQMSSYHLHETWSVRTPPRRGPTTLRTENCQEPGKDPNYDTFTVPCNAPRRAEKAGIFATTLCSEHVNG